MPNDTQLFNPLAQPEDQVEDVIKKGFLTPKSGDQLMFASTDTSNDHLRSHF